MLEADSLCSLRDTFSLEDDHSRRLRRRAARCTIYALPMRLCFFWFYPCLLLVIRQPT